MADEISEDDRKLMERAGPPRIGLPEEIAGTWEPPEADGASLVSTFGDGAPVPVSAGVVPVEIVNTLKTAWDVMKDNQPVANAASDAANAVPKDVSPSALTGWKSAPRTFTIKYESENPLGVNKTYIEITLQWYWNGRHRGTGQYISNAAAVCAGEVARLNKVTISASVGNPMNGGTPERPIAVLPITVTLKESNPFQEQVFAWIGRIRGDGGGVVTPV